MIHDLMTSLVSILQVIAPYITPLGTIFFVFLGYKFNRQLEVNKQNLSKKYEWKTKWAEEFFSASIKFKESIDDFIFLLHQLNELNGKSDATSNKCKEELLSKTHTEIRALQKQEFAIRSLLQFSPKNQASVDKSMKDILASIREIQATGKWDFISVLRFIREFNASCRDAHFEMLKP